MDNERVSQLWLEGLHRDIDVPLSKSGSLATWPLAHANDTTVYKVTSGLIEFRWILVFKETDIRI